MDFDKFNTISKDEIANLCEKEFENFNAKFTRREFKWETVRQNETDRFCGVYVFFFENVIWKIGKDQKNVFKRCREHIRDNSGQTQHNGEFEMKQIANIPDCEIMIFTLNKPYGMHWLIALESFLEIIAREKNVLLVKSGRVG